MSNVDEMGLTLEAAEGYETYFVPAIFHQWPAQLMHAANLSKGESLLDVGCGSGVLTREAISIVGLEGEVTGFDLSSNMLAIAKTLAPEAEFHQGTVTNLPFEDDSFDVVISAFMLMFVPEKEKAVHEMWRVLKPGGRLVLSVWEALEDNPPYSTLVKIAKERIDEAAGESLAWPFALGEEGALLDIFALAGIDHEAISKLTGDAKFPGIEPFVKTEIQAWVLADKVEENVLKKVEEDSKEQFQVYLNEDNSITLPLNAIVATATK